MSRRVPRLVGLALVLVSIAGTAHAQLISPGALTAEHANLEGLRNCTQCHRLGQRGVDPVKCLSCHEPLRDRIREGRGLHARLERDCGSCHSDHNGRAFDPVRLDTRRFDHRETGYPLVGEHVGATCRSCHTSDFVVDAGVRRQKAPAGRLNQTYLGVATDCATCHRRENPHSAALRTQDCASCHAPSGWDDVDGFEHASTGFRLTGAHVRASCTSCHGAEGTGAARFRNLPTTCASCHDHDDPHGRQFVGQSCTSCHTTAEWRGAAAFSHARTDFPLVGGHVRIACSSCHGTGRSARYDAVSASCRSCHGDESPHGAQFGTRECSSCHSPSTWASAPAFSHARTAFPLVGRHQSVDCVSCHPSDNGAQQFVGIEAGTCASCHDDAHGGTLGADCATCHSPRDWARIEGQGAQALAERFDHEVHTGFALVGAHLAVDCAACHGDGRAPDGFARRDADFAILLAADADGATFPAVRATTGAGACLSCHTDAHDGVLADLPDGADCASCHEQTAWVPTHFDRARHEAEAGFPLVGAHAVVPCGACHVAAADGPPTLALAPACASCHADESPHGTQFAGADGVTACGDCHGAAAWDAATFDHAARADFALTGAHAVAACIACHARPEDPEAIWSFGSLDPACATCHTDDDPHAGQFEGRACADCHDTDAFTLVSFDHAATDFPLVGAHETVPCGACHRPETAPDGSSFVRFAPLPTTCAGCHSE